MGYSCRVENMRPAVKMQMWSGPVMFPVGGLAHPTSNQVRVSHLS